MKWEDLPSFVESQKKKKKSFLPSPPHPLLLQCSSFSPTCSTLFSLYILSCSHSPPMVLWLYIQADTHIHTYIIFFAWLAWMGVRIVGSTNNMDKKQANRRSGLVSACLLPFFSTHPSTHPSYAPLFRTHHRPTHTSTRHNTTKKRSISSTIPFILFLPHHISHNTTQHINIPPRPAHVMPWKRRCFFFYYQYGLRGMDGMVGMG